MSETVFVTNRGEDNLVISYAYKEYVFEVNRTLQVPRDWLVFGYEQEDKTAPLVRLGWPALVNQN
jgi:hypothetical protein